jgi:hypothetical protein
MRRLICLLSVFAPLLYGVGTELRAQEAAAQNPGNDRSIAKIEISPVPSGVLILGQVNEIKSTVTASPKPGTRDFDDLVKRLSVVVDLRPASDVSTSIIRSEQTSEPTQIGFLYRISMLSLFYLNPDRMNLGVLIFSADQDHLLYIVDSVSGLKSNYQHVRIVDPTVERIHTLLVYLGGFALYGVFGWFGWYYLRRTRSGRLLRRYVCSRERSPTLHPAASRATLPLCLPTL